MIKTGNCRNQSDFRLSGEGFKHPLLDQANWLQVRVVIKQLWKLTINHEPRKKNQNSLLSISASEAAPAGVVVVVVVVAAQCLKSFRV